MINTLIATSVKIVGLHLSIEKQSAVEIDTTSEYTDAVVELDDGNKYIASFFTYDSLEKLKLEHQKTGEYLSGKYFRVDNMVLVESCSEKWVREVVEHLIEEGDFKSVFKLISSEV